MLTLKQAQDFVTGIFCTVNDYELAKKAAHDEDNDEIYIAGDYESIYTLEEVLPVIESNAEYLFNLVNKGE